MNIIEFAKFKKMFGGGGASAYTASSLSVLPTNVADGSVAIIKSDSLVGKWEFNETFNVGSGVKYVIDGVFCYRDSNGDPFAFTTLEICQLMDKSNVYIACKNTNGGSVMTRYLYSAEDGGFINGRAIEIFGNPFSGSIDMDYLIMWFETNATRIGGGNALYIYENGKWVYKCEIA